MPELQTIQLNQLWEKEQGWNAKKKIGRKFEDRVELAFWKKIAPSYSEQYNLCRDVPGLMDQVLSIIKTGNDILEIGCGTGNFTIPMAKVSRHVMALDFSPAMLAQLHVVAAKEHIENIETVCSKWETYQGAGEADFVVSVNSLYRIYEIEDALKKINRYGKKGFVIIRSLIHPYFHKIYRSLGITFKHNNDYMLIPLFLWNMGIRAEVQYFHYTKHCYYSTQTEIESEMIRNLGELTYMNYKEKMWQRFEAEALYENGLYRYDCQRAVEMITFSR